MVLAVGIDLVDLVQFRQSIDNNLMSLNRFFHEDELKLSVDQLAGCFAAKEALSKAVNFWFEPNTCAVLRGNAGRPFFRFFDSTKESFSKYDVHLSITNKSNLVIAMVVLE